MSTGSELKPEDRVRIGHSDYGDLHRYKVRNKFEWATIIVRPLKEGVEVMIHSSFGAFAHTWGCIGGGSWQEFLRGCDMDYAMKKLVNDPLSDLAREPTFSEWQALMMSRVTDPQYLAVSPSAAEMIKRALSNEHGEYDGLPDSTAWFMHFDEKAEGYPSDAQMYEDVRLPRESIQSFWNNIWVPWVRSLDADNDAVRDAILGPARI